MRRPSKARLTAAAALLLTAGYLVHVVRWQPLPLVGEPPRDGYARAEGVAHMHTVHSDGGGTVGEVVDAARRTGLDFVIVTDHNNLDSKPHEGYHDGVLLLVGVEVSTASGYLLGLGIPDPAFRFAGDAPGVLEDVRRLGGSAYAAHPTSARKEFAWRGWDVAGDWGLEVLNLDCQWRDAGWVHLVRAAALYPVNARFGLLGVLTRPDSVLENWDALLSRRHVPAIAAADAHSRIALTKTTVLRLPSYESLLAIAHNHVLLEDPLTGEAASDSRSILAALAAGRSYVGLDGLAPASGFFFEATAGSRRWTMGDVLSPASRPRLRAGGRLPQGARLVLLRDGLPLSTSEGSLDVQAPGAGVYRVEVYAPGWRMPWVLSNPIYVFEPAEEELRRRNALPPASSAAPPVRRLVDSFEGTTVFRAESDTSSGLETEIIDTEAPFEGRSAARMAFRLGDGGGRASASCALVTRGARDWTGASGIVFAIRGDAPYRVHVQVRDENRSGRDDGTETWFSSAKAETTWRRVAIPFAAFHSTDPHSDGRLDLDRIRLVAFVIDKAADKLGTRGTIWLDEVGVY